MIAFIFAALLVVGAPPARAADAPPGDSLAALSVAALKDRFVEATDSAERTRVLDQIAKTAPVSGQDVANLFDLFSRFTDKHARDSVMASLARIAPGSPHLEPLFMTYLRQPEPEAQLFGVNGAFRLRARAALPLIRAIAERKFAASAVTETTMMSERNAWWTQYEALSVLAQWEGERALPLLERKGKESAKVGALLGRYYWRQTLPKLRAWSASGDLLASERAALAAAAPIDVADARATRDQMLALLRNTEVDFEIRHHLALKIGSSSNDEEAEALVREHDALADDAERLFWAAAVFSTRSPKAVPVLVRYARQTDNETTSKGAAAQLVDMVGEAEARRLIDSEKKK
ncbi:MAG: hypothetical protein HY403_01085 [Elusimicrobia bacterium]|nr:hypothetical protein [Elusimicrobiota bacterium]